MPSIPDHDPRSSLAGLPYDVRRSVLREAYQRRYRAATITVVAIVFCGLFALLVPGIAGIPLRLVLVWWTATLPSRRRRRNALLLASLVADHVAADRRVNTDVAVPLPLR